MCPVTVIINQNPSHSTESETNIESIITHPNQSHSTEFETNTESIRAHLNQRHNTESEINTESITTHLNQSHNNHDQSRGYWINHNTENCTGAAMSPRKLISVIRKWNNPWVTFQFAKYQLCTLYFLQGLFSPLLLLRRIIFTSQYAVP